MTFIRIFLDWESVYGDSNSKLKSIFHITANIVLLLSGSVYAVSFLFILYLFFTKLRLCAATLFKHNKETQENVFDLAMKQLVCCISAILSTTVCGIMLIIWMLAETILNEYLNVNYTLAICYTLVGIDSAINSLCLILQWPFSETLYYKLCNKSHQCMEKFCFKNKLTLLRNVDSASQQRITIDEKNIKVELQS